MHVHRAPTLHLCALRIILDRPPVVRRYPLQNSVSLPLQLRGDIIGLHAVGYAQVEDLVAEEAAEGEAAVELENDL